MRYAELNAQWETWFCTLKFDTQLKNAESVNGVEGNKVTSHDKQRPNPEKESSP